MKLYGFPTFNFTKVLFTAEETQQPYDIQWINPAKGEHKTPEYLEKHPLGKVPCVEIEGEGFFESNNICRLLAELYDESLYGRDAAERARINQWIDLTGYHAGRWMAAIFYNEYIKPHLLQQEADPAALAEAYGFLEQQLPAIEKTLSQRDYLAVDRFTIADIILFSYCHTQTVCSLHFEQYPAIMSWYDRVANRPAFARAMAKTPSGKMFP